MSGIDGISLQGYPKGVVAGDRVEVRNVTKGIASIVTVESISLDGTGRITMTSDVSVTYDAGDMLYIRRIDENEEYPEYYHAVIGKPSGLTFSRSDMLKLARDIGHAARPLMVIEEV